MTKHSPRCPYHTEPTAAYYRIEYTYGPLTGENRASAVDHVCEAHYAMHKASLQAAQSVRPVRITVIEDSEGLF